MNKNLTKRIFTSIILLTLLLFSIFFHKYLWLILIIVASIICFFEFSKLTKKIWEKNESFFYLVNIL